MLIFLSLKVNGGIAFEDRQQHWFPYSGKRIGYGATPGGLAVGWKARIGLDPTGGVARQSG